MTNILSGGLLAAAMMVGQTGDAPKGVLVPPTMQSGQPAQRPILGFFNREERPVLNRLTSWFKRDQPDNQPKVVQPRPAIRETEPPPLVKPPVTTTPNDFPRKLPNPSSKAPTKPEAVAQTTPPVKNEVTTASVKQTAAPAAKTPILPALANKIGRDEKFEWITGQLEIENGNHVIYYATPETVDKYNGRIALLPAQTDMSKFKKGDLISVRGQLQQRQTLQGNVPVYRLSDASLIERAKS